MPPATQFLLYFIRHPASDRYCSVCSSDSKLDQPEDVDWQASGSGFHVQLGCSVSPQSHLPSYRGLIFLPSVVVTSIIRVTYLSNFSLDHTCESCPTLITFSGTRANKMCRDPREHAQLVICRTRRRRFHRLLPVLQVSCHILLPGLEANVRPVLKPQLLGSLRNVRSIRSHRRPYPSLSLQQHEPSQGNKPGYIAHQNSGREYGQRIGRTYYPDLVGRNPSSNRGDRRSLAGLICMKEKVRISTQELGFNTS